MSATIEEQARAALGGVRLTPACAIRCQPIRWLWPGWLGLPEIRPPPYARRSARCFAPL